MDFFKNFWLAVYPALCIFVPCIVFLILKNKKQKCSINFSKSYYIWRFLFVLYLFMVLEVTGIGSVWDIGKYGSVIRSEEIILKPFESEGFATYFLNIIMFMPLGFLLPHIWANYRSFHKTILTGMGFSLAIELGQLFNRRSTEIDDLLMNTMGAVLGLCIWFVFNKFFSVKPTDTSFSEPKEAAVYIGLAVLGRFLLYNWRFFVYLFYM